MDDLSRIAAAQVRGAYGERHRPMTIADRLSKMESAVDDAVTSGTLSGDQALQMKNELDDIAKILSHNSHKQNGSNKQTESSTQLSANDREKIRSHLKDLEKQLSSALNPKAATMSPRLPLAARGPRSIFVQGNGHQPRRQNR